VANIQCNTKMLIPLCINLSLLHLSDQTHLFQSVHQATYLCVQCLNMQISPPAYPDNHLYVSTQTSKLYRQTEVTWEWHELFLAAIQCPQSAEASGEPEDLPPDCGMAPELWTDQGSGYDSGLEGTTRRCSSSRHHLCSQMMSCHYLQYCQNGSTAQGQQWHHAVLQVRIPVKPITVHGN